MVRGSKDRDRAQIKHIHINDPTEPLISLKLSVQNASQSWSPLGDWVTLSLLYCGAW